MSPSPSVVDLEGGENERSLGEEGEGVQSPSTKSNHFDMYTIEEEVLFAEFVRKNLGKFVAFLLLSAAILYVIIDSFLDERLSHGFQLFFEWLSGNVAVGCVAFACVFILSTVFFLPTSMLIVGAGTAFTISSGFGAGLGFGVMSAFLGAFVGLNVSFLLGRYIFNSSLEGLARQVQLLEAVQMAIEADGLIVTSLLRLSPVVPFGAFNYVMGATRVKWRDYCIGSLGILPGTAAYVYIGALIGEAARNGKNETASSLRQQNTLRVILAVIGCTATFVAGTLVLLHARKFLRELRQRNPPKSAPPLMSDIVLRVQP